MIAGRRDGLSLMSYQAPTTIMEKTTDNTGDGCLSELLPQDAFAAAQMDAWLFWEQYSHEPYVAVARFQMVYLGKPAHDIDPILRKRGTAALDHLESRLAGARFLLGDDFSLADVALLAYTRLAHEGGFDLARLESVRRWIGESERRLGLSPVR